jgi:hypothetical protein
MFLQKFNHRNVSSNVPFKKIAKEGYQRRLKLMEIER